MVTQPDRIEAPNWFPDDTNTLYFNNGGKFYKVQAEPPGTTPNPNRLKVPEAVDLGTLTRINNDHGVTPDGKLWAFTDQSLIYTMPVGGGAATRVTAKGPVVFPRLVAGRQDAGVWRRAKRQFRRLHGVR